VQQAALLDGVLTFDKLFEDLVQIIGLHLGQEAQMTAVDTEDGDVLVPDRRGTGKEGSVTTDRERKINRFAVHVLRLFVSIPVLRKTRVLTQVQLLTQFLR
jgi:hypothetical protein